MQIKQKQNLEYTPMGEQILIVQFEDILSIENNQAIQQFADLILAKQIIGVKDVITSMRNLSVIYDPLQIHFDQLKEKLKTIDPHATNHLKRQRTNKTVHIPVVFDEIHGPDLPEISKNSGLSIDEIVEILCSKAYYVYMIGFIAGLPYMGDLDQRLIFPRKSNPRVKFPKGSVAIANHMTDIYTTDSPGGWHIIGWTPMEIFHLNQDPPTLLLAGDYVKYEPLSAEIARSWNSQLQKEWDSVWNI